MTRQFTSKPATREHVPLVIGIAGASGSGKTYSALLVARGLASSWDKVAMIDTEHGSGDLYSGLGDYCIATMNPPYRPNRAIKALQAAEADGFEVIILDSLSHFWAGEGGLLELHDQLSGNSYINWGKITPQQTALIEGILKSSAHVIATMRTKVAYEVEQDSRGKSVPRKIGMKPIQREGTDYEFNVVFDLNVQHSATCTKDRTGLFDSQQGILTTETGKLLGDWLEGGADVPAASDPIPAGNDQGQQKLDAMKKGMEPGAGSTEGA